MAVIPSLGRLEIVTHEYWSICSRMEVPRSLTQEIVMAGAWGALAWAVDPPAKLENARMLLKFATAEINVPDANGRPILSTAIDWSSMEMAQLLISSGMVNVDQLDGHDKSPLAYAVDKEYTPLKTQLLTRDPSRADVPDHAGATPRARALEKESRGFAKLSRQLPILLLER
ncbi:hypothetical protein NU219Hw_g444t1 [Hortaea werneckii]